jgi:hypothetical protein
MAASSTEASDPLTETGISSIWRKPSLIEVE